MLTALNKTIHSIQASVSSTTSRGLIWYNKETSFQLHTEFTTEAKIQQVGLGSKMGMIRVNFWVFATRVFTIIYSQKDVIDETNLTDYPKCRIIIPLYNNNTQ